MAAWRYEISLLVLKKYFEEKFRISARPCNFFFHSKGGSKTKRYWTKNIHWIYKPLNCGMVRILTVSYVNLFFIVFYHYHIYHLYQYYYFGSEIFMLKIKSNKSYVHGQAHAFSVT